MRRCGCERPIPSVNPRRQDLCERCGFAIPPDVGREEDKPMAPEPPRQSMADPNRNLEREREMTTAAAAAKGTDAQWLNTLAEHRSGNAPVRNLLDRDFPQEVREELADARNYLVWMMEQISLRSPGLGVEEEEGLALHYLGEALGHVAVALVFLETAAATLDR